MLRYSRLISTFFLSIRLDFLLFQRAHNERKSPSPGVSSTMEIEFSCPSRIWSDYRFLIPPSWIVSCSISDSGRRLTVRVRCNLDDWTLPPASVLWPSPKTLSFSRPLWENFFSLVVPLSWIVEVSECDRSVLVTLDPFRETQSPLLLSAPDSNAYLMAYA